MLSKKQRIIFTNSNSGYGIGSKQKFCDENSPLNPISLYGRTKAQAEKIVMNFIQEILILSIQFFQIWLTGILQK